MKRETSKLLMKQDISELLRDLKILDDSSEKDFDNKQYWAYEKFLDDYNTILSNLQTFGIAKDLKQIQRVPADMRVGINPGLTQYEVAKHREIVNESKKLLHRVEASIGLPEMKKLDTIRTLELIFSKFHSVARQLRVRYKKRATLDIKDEYDVQDLLHSLLKIYFQDIRPEETTPSYAGGSRRMDFLLKSEKVVIEVKKTREKLLAKEVSEELLVDIATYRHPDCNTLICFVYDPESIIGNPVGLEKDLAKQSSEKLKVIVYVYPK